MKILSVPITHKIYCHILPVKVHKSSDQNPLFSLSPQKAFPCTEEVLKVDV